MKTRLLLFSLLAVGLLKNNIGSAEDVHWLEGEPIGPEPWTEPWVIQAASPISFDKSYSALTAQQKAMVMLKYDATIVKTPPFPKNGLRAIYKPLLGKLGAVTRKGELVVKAIIDTDGSVSDVDILESPSLFSAKHAEKVIRSTVFDPATCYAGLCEMPFFVQLKLE